MITWMQRHKKYLVVTIWISVIAFVGAGFVGWGAYDFNSDRASSVAKVGDRKITVQEYQLVYANYYNFYNNMLDGGMTQEKADQMGLEKIVLESVINQTIILSYADEIGLRTTEDEVKNTLINDPSFQKDGLFDKDTYYNAIKQSQIKAKDYENGLKKQILLSKIQDILKLKPTTFEKELFVSSMLMKDRLAIDIIYLDTSEVIVDEVETKEYWDKHKTDYLSEKSYDLDTITVGLSDKNINNEELEVFYQEKKHNYKSQEGKILNFSEAKVDVEKDYRFQLSKREALENYLLFKKSELNTTNTKNVKISDISFPVKKLENIKIGETLKPIKTEDGYIIVRLAKINYALPKSYEKAKPDILTQLKAEKQINMLEEKAQAKLENFKGKDIGFVSRESRGKIGELNESESLEFVNFVFDNNREKNFKIIGNKAILYQILEQKLLDKSKIEKYVTLINDNISQMKQNEINQNLVVKLKKRYNVEQYYKGN
ncbi:MAG: peptidylprolyl isomerase [Sulfurospirillum sp.]|nr:peptidylprolyl isomerase [Sulfurospirillum sp.]MBL0702890.1 peptidylprolyl isomerase [Sulfurospirillum sp.]